MKRKRYTEGQIIQTLKQHEAGTPFKQLIQQTGISEQAFYRWKNKCGGMEVSDAKRLMALKEENRRLKTMVADLMLDNKILKDVNSKKVVKPAAKRKLVDYANERYAISTRQACRLLGRRESTRYYRPYRQRADQELWGVLNRLAGDTLGWATES